MIPNNPRSYKRLPCTTCVVFARCQHKDPLKCKILYQYIFNGPKNPSISTLKYKLKLIQTAFKKIVKGYCRKNKEFIIEWTTKEAIEEEVMMKVFGLR